MSQKIDALIAEHIFGFGKATRSENNIPSEHPWYNDQHSSNSIGWSVPPHYSTDIKEAWEVIEKMDDNAFKISNWGAGYRVEVYFNTPENDDYIGLGYHSEIAKAICIAALTARGVKID